MEKEIVLFFGNPAYAWFIAQLCISAALGIFGGIAAAFLTKRRPSEKSVNQHLKSITNPELRKKASEEIYALYKSLTCGCLILAFSALLISAHSGSVVTGYTGAADFFSIEGLSAVATAAGNLTVTVSNRVSDGSGKLHSLLYIPVGLILLHIPILVFGLALLFRHTMISAVTNMGIALGFVVFAFWTYLNPYQYQLIELTLVMFFLFVAVNVYTYWYARFVNIGGVIVMLMMVGMELATGILIICCGNYFYLFSAGVLLYILGPMAIAITAAGLVFAILLGNKGLPDMVVAKA